MREFAEVFAPFVSEVKAAIAEETVMPRILERIRVAMERLVTERDVAWPDRQGLAQSFYTDPQDLFSVCCGWDRGGRRVHAHDHGELGWAVYGVVSGSRVVNQPYQRLDDGNDPGKADLRELPPYVQKPGQVIVVPVGGIHETRNEGDDASYVVVIRSRDLGSVWRNQYDPAKGTVTRMFGFGRPA